VLAALNPVLLRCWGTWKGAHIPRTSKNDRRRALETEHLSLWEHYGENLEGRLLYWGPRRISQVRLWKWASGGPVLENMGGRCFPRVFERRVKSFPYWENFYWEIRKTCIRRLWKGATLSMGAPLGKLEGLVYWTFWETDEGGLWRRSISY
jgi:hypothetical protein